MLGITVIGRLVKDAEDKSEYSLSFTVAANFYDSMEKQEDVSFIKCFLDKGHCKHMHKFLTKGSLFYMNLTPIKMDVFKDKPSIMAKVNSIEFVGSKQSESKPTVHVDSKKVKNLSNEDETVPW